MNKRVRQYIGLFSAIFTYYVIHEGAHLLYALYFGVFTQINFMGLGMQIEVYSEKMTSNQLGIFCLLGSIATMIMAYVLVAIANKVKNISSKQMKACLYYITIVMLLIDPLYLSLLCGFFGGGDMNGISFLAPEIVARSVYGCLLVINVVVFFKMVLPKYQSAFQEEKDER